jgi:CubicO group peptidase (beta-lactamase class C family)
MRMTTLILLALAAPLSPAPAQSSQRAATPSTASRIDRTQLAEAERRARALPLVTSLIIARGDSIVLERYYRGMTAAKSVNVKSASKSILSALIGIAIDRKIIPGIDTRAYDIIPEYFNGIDDPSKRSITIRQLLTMTAGLESTSFGNYGAWVNSRDWVRYTLRRPFACTPGTCMVYSTGNSHLLSVILTRASGVDTRTFAQRHLFTPAGMKLAGWARDPSGFWMGGNEMRFTPRDMLKFGRLYLNGGMAGGKRVLPEQWIQDSWGEYATSPFNGHRYGYHWWTRLTGTHLVHFAWGYGGQFVFVVPDLDLVAVVTSTLTDRRSGAHLRSLHELLDDHIVPAFR